MRIAMLSWESLHSVAVGGVAAHVTELSAALQRAGHEVHVFTRMGPRQFHYERIDGVHYHRCPYPPAADIVDDVNSMCRIFVDRVFAVEDMLGPFDIVHAHDWLASNAMIWIKQGRQRLGFLTIHSTEYGRCGNMFVNGRSHRIRHQERAGTYWADRVIAVSEATKSELRWMYEAPDSKVDVVYNGVSPHRFDIEIEQGAAKSEYAIGPLDPTVLFCGRLTQQKGPDILLEAIPPILKYYDRAKFVFVGDGEMRAPLERRAAQLGISDAIRFLGYRQGEELIRIFKLCDAVCVPSRNEPFGIVVLEAWSARKPVVCTQVGGPNEYVWHDVNGLKIFPRPDSVAWGIGTLFTDFERAKWMGANGRQAVEVRFTWDHIAQETLGLYGAAMNLPQFATDTPTQDEARSASAAPVAQTPAPGVPEPEPAARPGASESIEAPIETPVDMPIEAHGPQIAATAELSVNPVVAGVSRQEVIEAVHRLLVRAGLSAEVGENSLVRAAGDYDRVAEAVRECHVLARQSGAVLSAQVIIGPPAAGGTGFQAVHPDRQGVGPTTAAAPIGTGSQAAAVPADPPDAGHVHAADLMPPVPPPADAPATEHTAKPGGTDTPSVGAHVDRREAGPTSPGRAMADLQSPVPMKQSVPAAAVVVVTSPPMPPEPVAQASSLSPPKPTEETPVQANPPSPPAKSAQPVHAPSGRAKRRKTFNSPPSDHRC